MSNDLADLAVVIMAGGAGTRFWPLSTEQRPKQFLSLLGQRTLLQQSFDRVAPLVDARQILVLTSARFVDQVREQLPELPPENVVGEPHRRDTAAAVSLAALLCQHRLKLPIMAMLTSDHHIQPVEAFQQTIRAAVDGVRRYPGALCTFGIVPSYPATSYGYLRLGERLDADAAIPRHVLRQFREKPNRETACSYLESGEYLWNSGMFIWKVETILDQLQQHLPGHIEQLGQAIAEDGSERFAEALAQAFEPLPATSIDYAVMERAPEVHCLAARFDWSDVGGWVALRQFLARDEQGNATRGQLHGHDACDNIVFCEQEDEHVALLGVRDLVVVRTGKRTLVMPAARAEEIKQLVGLLDPSLR
jgi:mannose-1-phosphate guanylyltransferase